MLTKLENALHNFKNRHNLFQGESPNTKERNLYRQHSKMYKNIKEEGCIGGESFVTKEGIEKSIEILNNN
jgi:hypothetical protein